ncbi:MAG: hypothetical protein PF450_13100 [Bacteroidales bacterium]|jgi:AAA family ATP:ADP antiporter|nr:hypothetical protein [Bacteroidales bacterium]
MMIFTVVIKSTLYGWLMKNYGLKVSLLISPVLLLIFTVVASVVGGLFGYGPESASFTFFFLVIALSKLFNKSLKDAIESPSMKILYQSLDLDERFDIQARIDGVVNELTAFSTGVLMAGLLMLSFVSVIYFSYILVVVLIIWVIIGLSLYKSYRKTLNDSLASAKNETGDADQKNKKMLPDVSVAPMYSEIIRLNPYFYHSIAQDELNNLLFLSDTRRKMVGWQNIVGTLHYCPKKEVDDIIKITSDPDLKFVIDNYRQRLKLPGEKIEEAYRSYDQNDILAALLQTVNEADTGQVAHIITLLRDRDVQLRASAIEAAGSLKVKELGSYLVDYLGHPTLYAVTWSALVNMGEIILENLENAFHNTGIEIIVQLRIVRAMIAIGGDKANEYLFQKVTYHQREIREAVIHGLYNSEFTPSEKNIAILQTSIYELVLAGALNVAAEFVIRENEEEGSFLEAMVEERKKTDKLLFALLGIAYDKSAIEHVQNSIEDTENVDTGFALELLNLIVDDEVFAYLEPYFDDISAAEKIRRLQNEMPVDILTYEGLLLDLLNRDGLYTGNYLKVCAIDALRKTGAKDAGQYLAAQVFHPNQAVSKSALIALSESDSFLHEEILKRMKFIQGLSKTHQFISEDYPGEKLIALVENIKKWKKFSSLERETIFRFVNHFEKQDAIELTNKENVSIVKSSQSEDVIENGIVINLTDYPAILEQMQYLVSQSELEVHQIKRSSFREILFDNPEVLEACNTLFCDSKTADFINIEVK